MMNSNTLVKEETIVVSLTTWHARINNIPVVLESILRQTLKPDAIVLNLAYEEIIPDSVNSFLEANRVIVNRVEDTKVYKKLLPTLELFPESCIINIDDDFIYPEGMIEDFMTVHGNHADKPISGNRNEYKYLNCHCGCASLTKKEFFGKSLDLLDSDVIANCPSDDLVFTYLMAREGRHYIHTHEEYFVNMQSFNSLSSYSESLPEPLERTWNYLQNRFGTVRNNNIIEVFFKKLRNFCCRHFRINFK